MILITENNIENLCLNILQIGDTAISAPLIRLKINYLIDPCIIRLARLKCQDSAGVKNLLAC